MPLSANFFSLAAALIPGLIFASAVVDRFRPPTWERTPEGRVLASLVLAAVAFAIYAEVDAVTLALGGTPTRLDIWVVCIAVVGGTAALAALLSWPWLAAFDHRGGVRRSSVRPLFAAVLIAFAAVLAVDRLAVSVELQTRDDRIRTATEKERALAEADLVALQAMKEIALSPVRTKAEDARNLALFEGAFERWHLVAARYEAARGEYLRALRGD